MIVFYLFQGDGRSSWGSDSSARSWSWRSGVPVWPHPGWRLCRGPLRQEWWVYQYLFIQTHWWLLTILSVLFLKSNWCFFSLLSLCYITLMILMPPVANRTLHSENVKISVLQRWFTARFSGVLSNLCIMWKWSVTVYMFLHKDRLLH